MQIDENERIVVNTPGYLKNLTEILAREPKSNVANYMLWRATRASIGFMNKAAKEVIDEYAKNITGKTETPPRWKTCVGSAAGSFSAAVGKMYVSEHFKGDAKESMLEMVADIREEFKIILNEVTILGIIKGQKKLEFHGSRVSATMRDTAKWFKHGACTALHCLPIASRKLAETRDPWNSNFFGL